MTHPLRTSTAKPCPLSPRLTACVAALLLAGTGSPHAQPAGEETTRALQLAQAEVEREMRVFEGSGQLLLGLGELGAERVVKGAPYCADAEHETVQWLPDGTGAAPNRIVSLQTSRLCRDAEGRTRQEIDRGGRKVIYLRDPVARENWMLDPERKTARRLTSGHGAGAVSAFDAGALREFAERTREWARGFSESSRQGKASIPAPPIPPIPPIPPMPAQAAAPPAPPTPPTPVLITRSDDGNRRTEVRVLRLPPGVASPAEEWAAPPPVQWRAIRNLPRGAGTVSPLPGKEIEGQRANGERTTWVIEAGKVGNDKPILITHEVWSSPELMLTLSSRDFDPRSGELSYRLKRVQRGEPDAALMRVPSDYGKPGRPANRASSPTG